MKRSASPSMQNHPLRGGGQLVVHATHAVLNLVEEVHCTIASGPGLLGSPLARPARAWTRMIYGIIRGVTQRIGTGLDLTLAQLGPLLDHIPRGPQREAMLAILNGVVGDHLSESGNPLAIPMELRLNGRSLALDGRALKERFPRPAGKLLVLVHGSSTNDLQWSRHGHDHGTALAKDLGYTPLYLRYNSGLHVSTNGRALSDLLEQLVCEWPIPVEELTLIGHSMGGLVSRSACLAAEAQAQLWRQKLRNLVCLGTPHHGAFLERGGSWADLLLGISRYSAPFVRLGQVRSAGITDMRFGNVLDEHWVGFQPSERMHDLRNSLSLPAGVACYAIAASQSPQMAERLSGDGLVSVDSALGRHPKRELTLAFEKANQWIALGTGHMELLSQPQVYNMIRSWISRK